MIKIEKNNITMIKGDTAYITVKFKNKYVYTSGDTLTLTIRNKIDIHTSVLTKEIEANGQMFEFHPNDTANINADRYVYDVQLNTANNEVFTVIPPSYFIIKEGITRGE